MNTFILTQERVEAVNQADAIIHDTESKLEEFKSQLPEEDVRQLFTLYHKNSRYSENCLPNRQYHKTYTLIMTFIMQANKLREQIAGVKELIAKKDQVEVEELKQATSNMQQASLKVFELAYKKVSTKCSIYCPI